MRSNTAGLALRLCLAVLLAEAAHGESPPQLPGDAALRAPRIAAPGDRHRSSQRTFQGIPSLERSPDGRLWAAWFARSGAERVDSFVLLASTGEDGLAWSEPHLAIDPPGAVRAFDPCLWLAPNGRLYLFWAQTAGKWDGRGGVWFTLSEDHQAARPTWSQPQRLCDGVMLNKPTALRDGTWLLPVSVWADVPASPASAKSEPSPAGARVYAIASYATDEASLLGHVAAPGRQYDEHSIAERHDGGLWMLIRTPQGLMESASADRGQSWTPAVRASIPHVDSRFCLRRLQSGRWLLITHQPPDGKTRSHLVAHVSGDEGKTWQGGLLLDERRGVSYPDAVEGPKGVIRVVYDFERNRARQILMAEFTEASALSGKATRSTHLRLLVNQAGAAEH